MDGSCDIALTRSTLLRVVHCERWTQIMIASYLTEEVDDRMHGCGFVLGTSNQTIEERSSLWKVSRAISLDVGAG